MFYEIDWHIVFQGSLLNFCSHTFSNEILFAVKLSCLVLQALIALKKGTQLLKYGRKGKPKFCPFRLSNVSLMLIYFSLLVRDLISPKLTV